MTDENGGKEPDRLTLWDETHKKKDGSYRKEATKEMMLEARHRLATSSDGLEEVPKELVDKKILEVMGPEHGGRVRGFGIGPNPEEYYGPKFSSSSENEVKVGEIIDQKLAERDAKHEQQLAERDAKHEQQLTERDAKHERELSKMSRMYNALYGILSQVPGIQVDGINMSNNEESPSRHSSHSSHGPRVNRLELM